MTGPVEAKGRTVEEAIDAALELLGATEDEVEIQILSEGTEAATPNFRGEARVLVRFRDERTEDDYREEIEHGEALREQSEVVPIEDAQPQADAVREFLEGLLAIMAIQASIEISITDYGVEADLYGSDLALLIGRHGLTLAALQELCRAVAQRSTDARPSVFVDIEHYLRRRVGILESLAFRTATKVRKTGKQVALEPMSARDRKTVHSALSSFDGVTTGSDGVEPQRCVVIYPSVVKRFT